VTEPPTDAAGFIVFNKNVIEEFRANAGKVGGAVAGADVLLLTTTGRRSGQPRVSPLAYFTVDGSMIVVGSYGGADVDPAWVHNLWADPHAHIEVGTSGYDVIARELPRAERDVAFTQVVAASPQFGGYQAKTGRVIPLFELRRNS
jgi:deazaflavin-dependent oxidoreductase (nitroreductase family)